MLFIQRYRIKKILKQIPKNDFDRKKLTFSLVGLSKRGHQYLCWKLKAHSHTSFF